MIFEAVLSLFLPVLVKFCSFFLFILLEHDIYAPCLAAHALGGDEADSLLGEEGLCLVPVLVFLSSPEAKVRRRHDEGMTKAPCEMVRLRLAMRPPARWWWFDDGTHGVEQ